MIGKIDTHVAADEALPELHMVSPPSQLRAAVRPAWRDPNPYCGLFADALVRQGVSVRELRHATASVLAPADVLLLHWPDEFFFRHSLTRVLSGYRSLAGLLFAKVVQRKRLIWIAHNLTPHERSGHRSRIRLATFLRLLDGIICLSETSRGMVGAAYPALRSLPTLVVSHGDYRAIEHVPPRLRRALPGGPLNLAFVGQIKPYKGVDRLAGLVADMAADDVRLTVAGACKDEELAATLEGLAAYGVIDLRLRYLDGAEMEATIDAADAIVLPYRDILNSGSALLALSRFRPIIVPRLGSLVELQAQVGTNWIHLYDGDLDRATLVRALEWLRTRDAATPPDLSQQDWGLAAARIAAFLRARAGVGV